MTEILTGPKTRKHNIAIGLRPTSKAMSSIDFIKKMDPETVSLGSIAKTSLVIWLSKILILGFVLQQALPSDHTTNYFSLTLNSKTSTDLQERPQFEWPDTTRTSKLMGLFAYLLLYS
ncbi:hypothetical protein CBL_05197 [Carabus blaptoides fortunei]